MLADAIYIYLAPLTKLLIVDAQAGLYGNRLTTNTHFLTTWLCYWVLMRLSRVNTSSLRVVGFINIFLETGKCSRAMVYINLTILNKINQNLQLAQKKGMLHECGTLVRLFLNTLTEKNRNLAPQNNKWLNHFNSFHSSGFSSYIDIKKVIFKLATLMWRYV